MWRASGKAIKEILQLAKRAREAADGLAVLTQALIEPGIPRGHRNEAVAHGREPAEKEKSGFSARHYMDAMRKVLIRSRRK